MLPGGLATRCRDGRARVSKYSAIRNNVRWEVAMTSRDLIEVPQIKLTEQEMQEAEKRALQNAKLAVVWRDPQSSS